MNSVLQLNARPTGVVIVTVSSPPCSSIARASVLLIDVKPFSKKGFEDDLNDPLPLVPSSLQQNDVLIDDIIIINRPSQSLECSFIVQRCAGFYSKDWETLMFS